MFGAHKKISPSGSDTWVPCPAAPSFITYLIRKKLVKEEADDIDPMSPSNEGTRAHLVLSTALEQGIIAEEARHLIPEAELTDETMADYVQVAINWVADYMEDNLGTILLIEEHVDTEPYTGTDETDGTSDIILINLKKKEIVILDFKYGKGVAVRPKDTHQLSLYGLGALSEYMESQFNNIILGICQPRHRDVEDIQLDKIPIKKFIKRASLYNKQAAIALNPNSYKNPDNFGPGEKQCRWCDATPHCGALSQYMIDLAVEEFDIEDPQPITEENLVGVTTPEVRAILESHTSLFKHWVNNISVNNTEFMLAGGKIPGFKLVEKRTNRILVEKDPKKVAKIISATIKEVTEQKILSMTVIEKIAKAHNTLKEFNTMIIKPEGDLTIAPVVDNRPEVILEIPEEEDDGVAIAALLN